MSTEIYKNEIPKTYKLEVRELQDEQPKLKLSTNNDLDLVSTFSQFIWTHDLSHPIIAAFLDSIGICSINLVSPVNEIFTVIMNACFWEFTGFDRNYIKELTAKNYYLPVAAKSFVSENPENYKEYLENLEVIELSNNLTKLTKFIMALVKLMQKYDAEANGIIADFENINKAI